MTAYELASLHAEIGQTINAQLANWLAILSIYLGAGFLAAHRMALSSAIAMSGIAVVTLLGFAFQISVTIQTFVGVSGEIQRLAQRGEGLQWHQAASMPAFAMEWFPSNSLISMFVVVAAAVYFFFSSRHQNLKSAPLTP